MAKKTTMVQIGKRKLELSNLEKVLFPEAGIVKAELIDYYLRIAPTLLAHIRGRALSLIRFPDGIYGEQFFQKNKPTWTPNWIESIRLDSEKKLDYINATEIATVVWLANLACIEIHQIHSRLPHLSNPDYMVFDIDPPEGTEFTEVVDVALGLRTHIESYGYAPFVKTTGRKGLHIVVPVEPRWEYHEVFRAARDVAQPFVKRHGADTTLHIKKEARKGKILIDIYRNRSGQTIVAPYSVRGSEHASVSTPLDWDEVESLDDPNIWNISSTLERVLDSGDTWEAIGAFAKPLHTMVDEPIQAAALPQARTYKTPEQLKSYEEKRSFEKTAEPKPELSFGHNDAFVVHRHHASRLHYDLRLEQDGTLKSWAVPRGLPPRPGLKRLAVAVEDHPIKYLNFEGMIPKGEYGGGMMWIYAQGRYERTKEKKTGFYFRLNSTEINAEYRMHSTRNNEWLLERVDEPQKDWLMTMVEPMLCESESDVPSDDENYFYEVKWDGIRALITLDEGKLTIRSRNNNDLTEKFPELNIPDDAFRASAAVFDAEIVCLDADGKPDFKTVIRRIQRSGEGSIKRASLKYPAYAYVFDCLYLDGRPIIHEPVERRREWMVDAIKRGTPYRISETEDDGHALFAAAREHDLEGIIAKRRGSKYIPGKRSKEWIKVKVRRSDTFQIIGYTEGKGDRASSFGAMHLMTLGGQYVGKVGTGFNDKKRKDLFATISNLPPAAKPFETKLTDDAESTWIEPQLICEVQYASMTKNGTLREPVFVRLRPDLSSGDSSTN